MTWATRAGDGGGHDDYTDVGMLRPLGDAAVEFAVPEEGGA
jgi:hypothetical protein